MCVPTGSLGTCDVCGECGWELKIPSVGEEIKQLELFYFFIGKKLHIHLENVTAYLCTMAGVICYFYIK